MDNVSIKTKFGDQVKFVLVAEQDSLNYDVYIDKGKQAIAEFFSWINLFLCNGRASICFKFKLWMNLKSPIRNWMVFICGTVIMHLLLDKTLPPWLINTKTATVFSSNFV